MRAMQKTPLPLTVKAKQPGTDTRLAVLLSFAAGLLIGVPLTFCVLFLGTLRHVPMPPIDEIFYSTAQEALHPRGDFQTIHGASSTQLRHPAETWLTNIRKSGLGALKASMPSRTSKHLGEGSRVIPSHASDVYAPNSQGSVPIVSSPVLQDVPTLVNGIFWTELSEKLVPKGFDDHDIGRWRRYLNVTEVLRVEEGCGRMQNRLVTLSEGGRSCCRYRHNNDQIQGEIFSFYLGRLLDMDNLSPSALALLDPRTSRWSSAASQMALARWSPERPAVLTQFVEDLKPAFVPRPFRDSKTRRLHPISEDLTNMTIPELAELVQWSDLIIFDYLTANLDRVVNNMYNERWNPGMMSQPTHNLAKTPEGLLLFLDNESGLLHGYRLLEKYEQFHRALLDVLCVFRKKTIKAIERLHRDDNVEVLLKQAFYQGDPGMSEWLPFLPDRSVRTLKDRMSHVLKRVQYCRSRFELKPDR